MGSVSDIAADGDRCQHCGLLLHKHYGGKRTRELLREWDGDIVFATLVDITCGWCGAVNEIFYQADMLPTVSAPRPGRWAWAAG
jgi:ribosomal protein S27E